MKRLHDFATDGSCLKQWIILNESLVTFNAILALGNPSARLIVIGLAELEICRLSMKPSGFFYISKRYSYKTVKPIIPDKWKRGRKKLCNSSYKLLCFASRLNKSTC